MLKAGHKAQFGKVDISGRRNQKLVARRFQEASEIKARPQAGKAAGRAVLYCSQPQDHERWQGSQGDGTREISKLRRRLTANWHETVVDAWYH